MTGPIHPSDSPQTPIAATGTEIPGEGIILQRGGEELLLEKSGDRFTVRLVAEHSLDQLVQQIGAQSTQYVPAANLYEIVVKPEDLEQSMQAARMSGAVEFASHVYHLANNLKALFYLGDEITIQFAKEIDAHTAKNVASSLGLQVTQAVEGVPRTFVFRVTQDAPANPVKLANRLMQRPDILTAEPNVIVQAQLMYRPRDTEYSQQWYLHNTGSPDVAKDAHIFAEEAWDITRGDRSIVVAVTDDAIDLYHPDFQGKGKIVAPKDFKDQGSVPLPKNARENHGTACAGLAIAEENGIGIVGVAPGCALMPIRTSGFLDDQAIEQIFRWTVEKGAAVVSCSWGPSAVHFPLSLRQRAAITRAATQGRNGKGCVVVFAAGNSNRPTNGTVNEQGWVDNVLKGPTQWLNGFAVHPDVITVAASTSLNKKAAYSNWGDNISVAAPSNNTSPLVFFQQTGFIKTAPAIDAQLPGKGVFTTDRLGAFGYDFGSYTSGFGGTSSACPLVAGVAALMLSANPNLTAREVKQLMQDTADKITDSEPDLQFGLQKGNYDAKGHSAWFGYGKVNAARAVRAARERLAAPQAASRWVQQQNSIAVQIPDNDLRGVTSAIEINDSSAIRSIQVTVNIEHSFLGDVEVSLIPPRGEAVLLQSRTLGRSTRLQKTYSLQTTPVLRQLLNQPARGSWRLHLIDYAPANTGKLNGWQLNVGV